MIIVFLTIYSSDTNHLTIVQPPPPYKTPDVCWRCGRTHDIVPLWECARCGAYAVTTGPPPVPRSRSSGTGTLYGLYRW